MKRALMMELVVSRPFGRLVDFGQRRTIAAKKAAAEKTSGEPQREEDEQVNHPMLPELYCFGPGLFVDSTAYCYCI